MVDNELQWFHPAVNAALGRPPVSGEVISRIQRKGQCYIQETNRPAALLWPTPIDHAPPWSELSEMLGPWLRVTRDEERGGYWITRRISTSLSKHKIVICTLAVELGTLQGLHASDAEHLHKIEDELSMGGSGIFSRGGVA